MWSPLCFPSRAIRWGERPRNKTASAMRGGARLALVAIGFQVFRTDYFDKQGKLYRRYRVLAVENKRYGYPTVVKASVSDLRDKSNTLAEYTQIKYDIDVPESIFTERYLRLPPQEHLKWRGSRPGTGQ